MSRISGSRRSSASIVDFITYEDRCLVCRSEGGCKAPSVTQPSQQMSVERRGRMSISPRMAVIGRIDLLPSENTVPLPTLQITRGTLNVQCITSLVVLSETVPDELRDKVD